MTVVRGEQNLWQTGWADLSAAIEMCGSRTGHAVQPVAFCQDRDTAEVLVDALALLKRVHDHWCKPEGFPEIDSNAVNEDMRDVGRLLERAGLLP